MARSGVEESTGEDLDLRSLGAALWRRKHWIIWPTLVAALISGIVVNVLTPRYKSEARIVYDGRENVFLRPDADKAANQDRGPADAETLTNQVQIVLSRQLALDVIGELKLNELPEFDPALRPRSMLRQVLTMVGISRDLLAMTPEERVLESWYDRLTAYAIDKSRVIVIEFQSADPVLAARITNAIADDYLRRQQMARQEQSRGAGEWLASEIEKLRRKVADAETKAEEFRANTNLLVGTNNTTLSSQQLGELNTQLGAARAQKADAETRARIIRDLLRRGEPIEAADVTNSELIRRLSEQRVTLRAQLAEQSSTLLDNHPRIKELRAQIADLDRQIRGEAEKIARGLENDARIATARVDALSTNLDSLKRQAATTGEQDLRYRALEREAKSQRDLLESYLAKYRETTARDTIATAPPDARIISAAIVSNTPAFPKKIPIVLVATLITFVLCAGFVTTQELLRATAPSARIEPMVLERMDAPDTLMRDPVADDLLPVSAAANDMNAVPPLAAPAANATVPHPLLGVSLSAVREIAERLQGNADIGRGVALFAAGSELATTLSALTLARALALNAKVVLVGLVHPAPVLDVVAAMPDGPGLTDVVSGKASFGEIVSRDKLSRLHIVRHGRSDVPQQALLNSRAFAVTLEALSRAYEHVVIDAGAIGPSCFQLAALAPRAVLMVSENAPADTTNAVQMLTAAGFADIAVMASGFVSGAVPHGQAAA
jgi:uncharacterized protein involved in exopolysaccharide biosynthesis/Mrp family chromosome partitioning ATPase